MCIRDSSGTGQLGPNPCSEDDDAHRPECSYLRLSACVNYAINCGLDTVGAAGAFEKQMCIRDRIYITQ